jgi:chromosome segregation ATPase
METRQQQTMVEIKRLNTMIQDLTKESDDSKNKLDKIKEENFKKHGNYLERMDKLTKELETERSRNAELAKQNKSVLELRNQVAKLQLDSLHWRQRSESGVAKAKELSAKLADADILHSKLESQLQVSETRFRRSLASAATEADALSRQLRASAQDYEELALKISCLDQKHCQARKAWQKERSELEAKADQLEDELQYRELKSRQEKRATEGQLQELCEEVDDLLQYVATFFVPRDCDFMACSQYLYVD